MTAEVGEVVVDASGNATGHGLAFRLFEEILAPINADDARAVAKNVGPFCVGLANALKDVYGDEVDASTSPGLCEFHACELPLTDGGGSELFSGSTHSSQGFAWVRVLGSPNVFVAVRVSGSSYMADETMRIVRFRYRDDGGAAELIEFSEELQIGHGQSLSAFADDAGQVTLYCSAYTGDSGGVSVQKGFSRITWRGAATAQSDVENIVVLPDDNAGEQLSRYFSVTPCVSQDGSKLVLSANDNTREDSTKYLMVYDFAAVIAAYEASGDALAVQPLTIIHRPALGPEGMMTQGLAATSDYIYVLAGYYQPFGDKFVEVFDWSGNALKRIQFAGSLNDYSIAQLLNHPTQGIPSQFEPEDLTLTDDGVLLICMCESWLSGTPVVTFEDANYAAIRDASGLRESPRDDRLWVPTAKTFSGGATGASEAGLPVVEILEAPANATSLWIDIDTSGFPDDALFRWSTDAGAHWSASLTVPGDPGTIAFGDGFELQFESAMYVAGTRYTSDARAWSDSESYTASVAKERAVKQVWGIRTAGTVNATNEYQLNAARYCPQSGAEIRLGKSTVDISCPPHQYVQIQEFSPNTGSYVLRFLFTERGIEFHDGRVGAGSGYSYLAYERRSSREYAYWRAASGDLDHGGGINIYGSNDPTNPDAVRLYQGQGAGDGVGVHLGGGVLRSFGGTLLGSQTYPWPSLTVGAVDNAMWFGPLTSAGRQAAQFRAAGAALASGAGFNAYGSEDSTAPNAFRIYQGGGSTTYVEINGGVWKQEGDVTLGSYSDPWPYTYTDVLRLKWWSVNSAPDATLHTGQLIAVQNGDAGAPCLALSNGTSWLRIPLGAAISTT